MAMHEAGAECISVLCPQCFNQFDTGQMMAGRALKLEFKLPVLFYTQLMALSMGYSLDEIHYRNHRIRDDTFSEKLGRFHK
jgi:heterodisulfide reductase subunit B